MAALSSEALFQNSPRQKPAKTRPPLTGKTISPEPPSKRKTEDAGGEETPPSDRFKYPDGEKCQDPTETSDKPERQASGQRLNAIRSPEGPAKIGAVGPALSPKGASSTSGQVPPDGERAGYSFRSFGSTLRRFLRITAGKSNCSPRRARFARLLRLRLGRSIPGWRLRSCSSRRHRFSAVRRSRSAIRSALARRCHFSVALCYRCRAEASRCCRFWCSASRRTASLRTRASTSPAGLPSKSYRRPSRRWISAKR